MFYPLADMQKSLNPAWKRWKPDDTKVTRRLMKEKRWPVLLMFWVTGVDKRFPFLSNGCLKNHSESKNFPCLCRIVLKKHASPKIGQQLLLEHIVFVIPKKFLRVLNCLFDRNVVNKNFNGLLYQALQAMLLIV